MQNNQTNEVSITDIKMPFLSMVIFLVSCKGLVLNKKIHRQLMKHGVNIPSTTMVGDKFVIRPCFLGARTDWHHADDLVNAGSRYRVVQ